MPDPFNVQPPHQKHPVQEIRRRLAQGFRSAMAPVARQWRQSTAPISRFLAPIRERYLAVTAPIRRRWQVFASKNRTIAIVLKIGAFLIALGFSSILLLVLLVRFGAFGGIPSTEELRNIETANASEIYTSDSIVIGKFYIENRTAIGLEGVSQHVINALIATEDKRFFEHQGIDIISLCRVAYGMLTRRESMGGGSTLSQQLAKNLYPRKPYKFKIFGLAVSKIRENFISLKLERIYSKEELLDLYLNTVPFGGDVFGINVAAKQYFNRKPKDLSADQAATLIGMLKATSRYHPVRNPENAKGRRNIVLQQMVKNRHLTEAQYLELKNKPVGAKFYGRDNNNEGMGTYFREYLRTEIMPELLKVHLKEDGTPYNLYTDGLKIYTTLNSKMQQYAEEAVAKHMQELQKQFDQHWKGAKKDKPWGDDKWLVEQMQRSERWSGYIDAGLSKEEATAKFKEPVNMTIFTWKKGGTEVDTAMSPYDSVRYYFCLLNTGFIAMDHRNGHVRAWVGGTNFKYFKYDHILSRRQVGSTFKPIVYAAALQDSIRPCDYFPNRIVKLGDWEPHNADENYGGFYSLVGALQRSVNVVAAQLIEKVGIQKTIDLAKKMGITSKLPREFGISLGATEVSLIDMIKVYGTLANKGVRPDPVLVVKIIDREGNVIYDQKQEVAANPKAGPHERALTVDQAAAMTRMLQNVVNYGTGARLRSGFGIQGDFAGKTGTTQNHADGWFICYNPQLVTGAWVGAPSPAVRFRYMALGQGSAMALPIVGWFWHKMANDRKYSKLLQEKFQEPSKHVLAQFNCYPWIGYSPDEWYVLMQDSVFRDSIQQAWSGGAPTNAQEEPSEAPPLVEEQKEELKMPDNDEDNKDNDGDDANKQERRGIFRELFGQKKRNQKDGEEGIEN